MVEQKEKSLLFELQSMQYIEEHRHSRIEQPHKHDYYVIIWIVAGTGTHQIDFEQYAVQPQTIAFITPGQIHHLQMEHNPKGYAISFHNDFFCINEQNRELLLNTGLFYGCTQHRDHAVSPQQAQIMEQLVLLLQQEYKQQGYMHTESLRSLLKVFLVQAARFWGRPQNEAPLQSKPAQLTRSFLSLLETHFMQSTKVSHYAAKLNLSPSHLNDTIKETTGFSASEHIKNRVVLEAKRLAYLQNSSAKEIAYQLGFDDEAHFSRYFKNNSGTTFTAFKQLLAQGQPAAP
jgi:AraC family transcriptional regulator, transcriptional activator of pobA